MGALEIIGAIIAVILFFGFFAFMCIFIALGILHDEDTERAEEILKHWFEHFNDNNMNL